MIVATLATADYASRVAVLAASVRAHAQVDGMLVVDLDGTEDRLGLATDVDVLTVDELPIADDELAVRRVLYSPGELAMSLKADTLLVALERSSDGAAVWIDADCRVYDSLAPLLPDRYSVPTVLTPHVLQPLPLDGRQPDQPDLLAAGVTNTGVLAASRGSEPLLRWWSRAKARDCFVDPGSGVFFGDQRILDLALGMYPVAFTRDRGVNVAYWNAHERDLQRRGDVVMAGADPLRVAHFSGIDVSDPHVTCRFIPPERLRPAAGPDSVLGELVQEYVCELQASARCQPSTSGSRTTQAPLSLGSVRAEVGVALRKRYRRELLDARHAGGPVPPSPDAGGSMRHWWGVPPDGGRLDRLARAVWQLRPDLQAVFPEPDGRDWDALMRWADTFGRQEGYVPDDWQSPL